MEASDSHTFVFIVIRIWSENLKQSTATYYRLEASTIQNRFPSIVAEEFL